MTNHIARPIQDINGDLVTTASVAVYQPGTTTHIADTLYADKALTVPRANPFAATTGVVDFYLATAQLVRLGITKSPDPEVFVEDIGIGDIIPVVNPVVITTISVPGALSVGAINLKHYIEDASDLVYIRGAIGTAPVGSTLTVDVLNNGTSLFSGTPTNAPHWATTVSTPVLIDSSITDTDSFAAGSYFTLNVTQVGSSTPGSDLVIKIATRKN